MTGIAGGRRNDDASRGGIYAMEIHESAEDYLEKILVLQEKTGYVRSIDVANSFGYSKASISVAMKKLRENGYVHMDEEGQLSLTASGMEVAVKIYARHKLLTRLLIHLGIEPEKASAEACRLEHDISDETFELLSRYLKEKIDTGEE